MKEMIVIDNHGDISFFSARSEAEGWVEAIDIENNEFEVFDAEGQIMDITTRGNSGKISPRNPPQYAHDDLRNRLLAFFQRLKVTSPEIRTLALRELVEYGLNNYGT